jgi:peroxiredoxin
MLRALATVVIVALFLLNWMLPSTGLLRRGVDPEVRVDVEASSIRVGEPLPDATLFDLRGVPVGLSDLRGNRVLLVFERSIDWCPFTKSRLLDLKQTFAEVEDLEIVWVMALEQCSERTRRLIDEYGLRDRIYFLADEQSRLIRDLGLLKPEPEVMEEGVPHPTTLLLDRDGIVRFIDVREDYRYWLDPDVLLAALESIP